MNSDNEFANIGCEEIYDERLADDIKEYNEAEQDSYSEYAKNDSEECAILLQELCQDRGEKKARGERLRSIDLDSSNPFGIPYSNENPKIGRNDACPCGSNKKYKKCCMRG